MFFYVLNQFLSVLHTSSQSLIWYFLAHQFSRVPEVVLVRHLTGRPKARIWALRTGEGFLSELLLLFIICNLLILLTEPWYEEAVIPFHCKNIIYPVLSVGLTMHALTVTLFLCVFMTKPNQGIRIEGVICCSDCATCELYVHLTKTSSHWNLFPTFNPSQRSSGEPANSTRSHSAPWSGTRVNFKGFSDVRPQSRILKHINWLSH